ncbi:MAG: caspase family protein [Flavipsychrobacter sp.]|nr:caspase family protein [Flavipsychrobacter sp.]
MADISFDTKKAFALTVGIGARPAKDDQRADNEAMAVTALDAERVYGELKGRLRIEEDNLGGLHGESAKKDDVVAALDLLVKNTNKPDAETEMVIIYFSGHGQLENGNYYLVCYDTTDKDMARTAIPGSVFVEKLQAIKSEKVLVFLDCCHSGGFATSADVPMNERDKNEFLGKPNRVIISASHAKEYSYASTPLSIFTYALVEGLAGKFFEDGDKEVTLFNLAMYLRERVYPLSEHTQRPQLNIVKNAATTDFSIIRYPKGKPKDAIFTSEFILKDGSGKGIEDKPVERDEEYRQQFNWIMTITGNNNVGVQAVNSTVSVNTGTINNYYTTVQPDATRPYNLIITQALVKAIAPYYPDAQSFLEDNAENEEWYANEDLRAQGTKHIVNGYVGDIGILLGRLMGIGETESPAQKKEYIKMCIIIAQSTLKLLCFSLIADLYKQRNEKEFALSSEQRGQLETFFTHKNETGMSIEKYRSLFESMHRVYKDQELVFPITELDSFSECLAPENTFSIACVKLNEIATMNDTLRNTLDTCNTAEISIAYLLAPLGFLAAYKMASVKSINYENLLNESNRYLHSYTSLSGRNLLNYVKEPVNADAVLLYKDNYVAGFHNGVNLFPFAIDNSELNSDQEDLDRNNNAVMICYYNAAREDKPSPDEDATRAMKFFFPKDSSVRTIYYSNIITTGKINTLVNTPSSRKKLKVDNAFIKLDEVRDLLLGVK